MPSSIIQPLYSTRRPHVVSVSRLMTRAVHGAELSPGSSLASGGAAACGGARRTSPVHAPLEVPRVELGSDAMDDRLARNPPPRESGNRGEMGQELGEKSDVRPVDREAGRAWLTERLTVWWVEAGGAGPDAPRDAAHVGGHRKSPGECWLSH